MNSYEPGQVPADPKQVQSFLASEFVAVKRGLENPVDFAYLRPLPAAPMRPRDGMSAYADGVNWNPGNGKGLYSYDADLGIWTRGVFGYVPGQGGIVVQSTSKSTGVTLDKPSGVIVMDGAALAANTTVSFLLTNSYAMQGDTFVFSQLDGTLGGYIFNAVAGTGAAVISVRNITSGSLSESISLQFNLIKGSFT